MKAKVEEVKHRSKRRKVNHTPPVVEPLTREQIRATVLETYAPPLNPLPMEDFLNERDHHWRQLLDVNNGML